MGRSMKTAKGKHTEGTSFESTATLECCETVQRLEKSGIFRYKPYAASDGR